MNNKINFGTWVILGMFLIFGVTILAGCQTYQPPGENLWKAL